MTEKIGTPKHSRPAAGRPTRDQAEARRAELLDRALDLFLDHGYDQTTIEGVAAAVGMAKRTIYARYEDKAALFRAAVDQAIGRWVMPEEGLLALDRDDLETTLTAVARLRVAHVLTQEGRRMQRILNIESYRFPEIFTAAYDRGSKPVIDFLADVLEHHHRAGTIAVDRPVMAATVFLNMVVGGSTRSAVSGVAPDPAAIEDRMTFAIALFLNGVRPR